MIRKRPAVFLLSAVCLLAVGLLAACRRKDPVPPAREALAAYVAAVDAFAARAEKASDAASAAAAVSALKAELIPVTAAVKALGTDFPELADPGNAPAALKADVAGAEEAAARLTAAMTKVMVWGYVPAVKEAVASLAEVEALFR